MAASFMLFAACIFFHIFVGFAVLQPQQPIEAAAVAPAATMKATKKLNYYLEVNKYFVMTA